MRLIRWLSYEWTRRYAIQILIYRSKTITRHVLDVRQVMIGMGYPLGGVNDLWSRTDVMAVAKRHPELFKW